MSHFCLTAFKILCFCLSTVWLWCISAWVSFDFICLGVKFVELLEFVVSSNLWNCWPLVLIFSDILYTPFSLLQWKHRALTTRLPGNFPLSSQDSYHVYVCPLDVSHRFFRVCSLFCIILFSSDSVLMSLYSSLIIIYFVCSSLLLSYFSEFCIFVTVLFSSKTFSWFLYIISFYWNSHVCASFFQFPLALCSCLKSLSSSRSGVWAFMGTIFVNLFFL